MAFKKNNITYFIGFIILAIVAFWSLTITNKTKAGNPTPSIDATLIDGNKFNLSDLKGNYILLDFWGSWCLPCRRENPKLSQLYTAYNGKAFNNADGFEIVTIALEKNDKTWKAAAQKDGFLWKYQIVEVAKFVALSNYARKYGVTDIPSKFLILPDGTLHGKVTFEEVEFILKKDLKK